MVAEFGLAVVGGRAEVVDRNVVGGDYGSEVEELIEVALTREGYHDNGYSMVYRFHFMYKMIVYFDLL